MKPYDIDKFTILETVCANAPNKHHYIIMHVQPHNRPDDLWITGDDSFCALTKEDFIRNNLPYNDVLIKEYPYIENTPESFGEYRPLIEEFMEVMLTAYMERDGLVHVYPQWVPAFAYKHLGQELFDQLCEGCSYIILYESPQVMEFIPSNGGAPGQKKQSK